MKNLHKIFSLFLLPAAMLLSSCEGDLAVPPIQVPEGIVNQNGVIGKGTPEVPLTVYQVSIGTLPAGMEKAWATGYIVGAVNSDIAAFINKETVEWAEPFSKQSNILLAQDPNYLDTPPEDRDLSQLIAVGFTYGYDTRTQLNLVKNPKMLGKQVSVYGTTNVKYFGQYGMKDCTFYQLGDKGFPLFSEKFEIVSLKEGEILPDGVYTLYADGYAAHIMESASYFYGYIANRANGIITSEGPEGCFEFTFTRNPDTGYYTIRQSDGRYLNRTSANANFKGFDFTDTPDSAGAQFSIVVNEDATFTIKNVYTGFTMLMDTSYHSFSLYSTLADGCPYPYIVKQIK